jgi:hypothetical protein
LRHKLPFLHPYTSCGVAPEREERRRSPEEATDSRFDVLNFGTSGAAGAGDDGAVA